MYCLNNYRLSLCCKTGTELSLMFEPENSHYKWVHYPTTCTFMLCLYFTFFFAFVLSFSPCHSSFTPPSSIPFFLFLLSLSLSPITPLSPSLSFSLFHSSWLCHMDDDTYIHLKNTVNMLSLFDPKTEAIYLGQPRTEWYTPRPVCHFLK